MSESKYIHFLDELDTTDNPIEEELNDSDDELFGSSKCSS
jgi:hypothetical protein